MASRPARKPAQRKHFRRGAAAVEFAVVAPLFFLLLAGIIEFGQAFRVEHMLSTASRRGARAAVVDGATTSRVRREVKKLCAETLGVKASDITVTIAVNGNSGTDLRHAETGDEIRLTVQVPYSKAGVGFYASTFSNSSLASTCTMERELSFDR